MFPNQAFRSRLNSSSETKSLGQRAVLGTELARGGVGLVREALDVEALMVRRPLERRQAGGDGVVRARLDLDVIRRIRVHQMNGGTVEQAVHVFGLAGVRA